MKRKLVVVSIAVALGLLLFIPVGTFFALQSPRFINSLSSLLENQTGYRVHVQDISVDRRLHAEVRGLSVQSVKDDRIFLSASAAEVKGNLSASLKVEIASILLVHPKFVFHVKKSAEETNLFAALEKIPPVRLLTVQDGTLEVATEGSNYVVPGIHLTVRDFSPRTGGDLKLQGQLRVTSPAYAFAGAFDGAIKMTRFTPAPTGAGSLRLSLDSASFDPVSLRKATCALKVRLNGDILSFDDMKVDMGAISSGKGPQEVAITDIHLGMGGSYDQKSSRFNLASLRAAGPGIGSLTGRCEGFMKPLSWDALINAEGIDVVKVFAVARPFLPKEYQAWTFKGVGAVEIRTKGRSDETLVWSAEALLDLSEGGFTSADSLKAGERITGKVRLKLSSPERKERGRFDVTMKASDGEFLWGKFYRDFRGEFASISSQGSFIPSPLLFSCTGSADLFQTGRYTFSADLSPGESLISFDASDLSHGRLFSVLAGDYVAQNYPDMADLRVQGTSDLRVAASIGRAVTTVDGYLAIRDGAFAVPSMGISLAGLRLSLPLDFSYPGPAVAEPLRGDQGLLSFDSLKAGELQVDKIEIPVLLSKNTLLVPVQIDVPLFGGAAHLTHLRVDRLLSPDVRLDAGLFVEDVNLATLTEKLAPVAINGTLAVDLPSIVSQDGQWKTRGRVEANVFGGEVEVTNIFANDLFSRGRSLGCDVRFDDIDLEAMTDRIEVGKVTGIIKGFVRNLAFEYGQPSRFVLSVETDTEKKAPRKISVDAIKNLSVVSTGSGAISSVLNSGINRFFKEYPYSRIGIACSLENDAFSLRGTIHEGGKEYLVRRALFRGVDVVNQNPDNAISFKDMQERISRIFRPRQEPKNVS